MSDKALYNTVHREIVIFCVAFCIVESRSGNHVVCPQFVPGVAKVCSESCEDSTGLGLRQTERGSQLESLLIAVNTTNTTQHSQNMENFEQRPSVNTS